LNIRIHDVIIVFMDSAPELSPLFRSDSQGEILALLLLNPGRAYTIAELARTTGTSYASTHREVNRLLRTEVLSEDRVGTHHQIRANMSSPIAEPLQDIVLLTYGPAVVIPRLLESISGIEEAYIYGSWAARRSGEPGSPPRDIDVLVVGNPSRAEILDAAEEAGRRIGRDVNIRVTSARTWHTSDDPFVKTVRSRPLTRLNLGER
jgi:predicted nucleotidyltransferase